MNSTELFSLYRQMLLIRRFEEKSAEMYALAKIAGFLHLYIGEDAIAVGAIASLAVGAVRDVPVIVAGTVKAGRRMQVTLSCDHRAIDGVTGAKFLTELKRILEHPHELAAQQGHPRSGGDANPREEIES